MGEIPEERLSISEKPFSSTGIDYFGPFLVKYAKHTRRNSALNKRYGVIYTCLTTRAIHLELAGDLSTDSFILSLRRFIARRGHVKVIRTDNGSNFIGAAAEIKEKLKQIDHKNISNFLSMKDIEWRFNPPHSPWMGGSWESLIKSVKRSLAAITKGRTLTEDVLGTLLCEIESILNNRPLTHISDDIADFDALTPNHILLGTTNSNVEPTQFDDIEINYRKQWKTVQAYTSMFWKRWLSEYLPTLSPRKKWTRKHENLAIGDLVIVANKNSPKSHWPLARIVAIYPGKDGIVRTIKIKTPSGEFIRSTQSVFLLEGSKH